MQYWQSKKTSRRGWQVAHLRHDLAPFEFGETRPMTPEEQDYSRYYGLDLEVDHPDVEHRIGKVSQAGYDLAVHSYTRADARGTVFVFHGYFDHAGLYGQLFDACLAAGFNVICWDLPGHGLSGGAPAAIGSFREYQKILSGMLARCEGRLSGPWVAVGQSTGGAILIDYLLSQGHSRDSSAFSRVVLLAPLVRPTGWLPGRILYRLVRPFLDTWGRGFSHNSNDPDFLEFLRERDPLQARALSLDWVGALKDWVPRIENAAPVNFPVTVVQGELDMTVAWRHNLRIIRNKFVRTREILLPHGRHHLVNETPAIQQQVFAAVQRELRELGERVDRQTEVQRD